MSAKLSEAIALASKAHCGQLDKGGKPYILHPIRVMQSVIHLGEEYAMAAILHDVVEDTAVSFADLVDLDYPSDVIDAVRCLTKLHKESYKDYIARVESHSIAIEVKKADIKDNMDLTRLKGVTEKDLKRTEKYVKTYHRLSQKTSC